MSLLFAQVRAELIESGGKIRPAAWSLIVLPGKDSTWVQTAEKFPSAKITAAISQEDIAGLKHLLPNIQVLMNEGRVEPALRLFGDPPIPLIYDLDFVRIFLPPGVTLPHVKISRDSDVQERVARERAELKLFLGKNPEGFVPGGGSLTMPICELLKKRGFGWTAGNFPDSEWGEGAVLRLDLDASPFTVFKVSSLSNRFHRAETQPCVWDRNQSEQVFAEIERLNAAGILPALILDESRSCVKLDDLLSHFFSRELTPGKPEMELMSDTVKDYGKLTTVSSLQVWPFSWNWIRGPEPGLTSWIGSAQKNAAWESYVKTRLDVDRYKNSGSADLAVLDQAMTEIFGAQSAHFFEMMEKPGQEFVYRQKLARVNKWIGKADTYSVRTSSLSAENDAADENVSAPENSRAEARAPVRQEKQAAADRTARKIAAEWVASGVNGADVRSGSQTVITRFEVHESSDGSNEDWAYFLVGLNAKYVSTGFAELYMDINHRPGAGSATLITQRNALLDDADGWEFALTARKLAGASWSYQVTRSNDMKLIYRGAATGTGKNRVGVEFRVPRALLGKDLSRWGYLVLVSDKESGTVQDLIAAEAGRDAALGQLRDAGTGLVKTEPVPLMMWRPAH